MVHNETWMGTEVGPASRDLRGRAMIVCVAGMHRSGTSLVTRLLHLCGLGRGPEGELIPATAANTDGHLEHRGFVELNDQVLARLGGGWDLLPPLLPAWERESALDP